MGLMKRLSTGRIYGEAVPEGLAERQGRRAEQPEPVVERNLWYFFPGCHPLEQDKAQNRLRSEEPLYFCREGDLAWRPIGELNEQGKDLR